MKLLINSQISTAIWESLLNRNPFGSVFQSVGFYELFNSIQGFSADVFAVENNGEICALCVATYQKEAGVRGYFSRRAIIYGGPLLEAKGDDSCTFLLQSIVKAYKQRSIYIEIRNLFDYEHYKSTYLNNGWQYIPYQNYILDCSDYEKVISGMGQNRRRQIRKATNSGVELKEAENLGEVREFYLMLKHLYINKILKPLFPLYFFEEFFKRKLAKFLLVTYKGNIIGGIMCPVFQDKFIYEFYICGLDDDYKEQFPSVMATFAAIQYAFQNKIGKFDFMGAGLKDHDYGVREFKARFGGEFVEYGRMIFVSQKWLYFLGKITMKIIKGLKSKKK